MIYKLAVILLLVLVNSVSAITLVWDYTQGTDLAVEFIVDKRVSCDGSAIRFHIPISTQTFTDSGLFINNMLYCYTVVAADSTGIESAPSNVVMFQVQEKPAAPTNLHSTVN